MSDAFRHVDAERTIFFGTGALDAAGDALGDGFTLLTTERALASAPSAAARAANVVHVPAGRVEQVAGDLRTEVRGDRLVALGGGRVIDVAKALAAADGPRTVAAIPTTISGAEMTGVHRHAQGVAPDTPRVRPRVVVNDPALSASQPAAELAASTANALGHTLVALVSDRATPITGPVAHEAARRLVLAWGWAEPDRPDLALGALLAGWVVDLTGLGLHHVLSQTAVRTASVAHSEANAAVLPVSVGALRARRPEMLGRLEVDLGVELDAFARSLCGRAGVHGIPALAADEELLERAVEAAAARPELERVPPAPDHAELRALYLAAAAPGPD